MGVVHGQRPYSQQACKLSGLLVAVAGSVLGKAHRQIAVAPRHRLVDHVVVRAVHRLEVELFPIHFHRREHAVRIVRQVPGSVVEILLGDVRGGDALVAAKELPLLCELFQFIADHRAVGHPEG